MHTLHGGEGRGGENEREEEEEKGGWREIL
jgi:hypothetical protein